MGNFFRAFTLLVFLIIFSEGICINLVLATDQQSSEEITKSYRFTTIDVVGKREIRLHEKHWLSPGYTTKLFDRNGFF